MQNHDANISAYDKPKDDASNPKNNGEDAANQNVELSSNCVSEGAARNSEKQHPR
jgi:hypothetical protein